MLIEDNIHVRSDFLNDDLNGFEEKKRNTSFFEIKCHYENEIE